MKYFKCLTGVFIWASLHKQMLAWRWQPSVILRRVPEGCHIHIRRCENLKSKLLACFHFLQFRVFLFFHTLYLRFSDIVSVTFFSKDMLMYWILDSLPSVFFKERSKLMTSPRCLYVHLNIPSKLLNHLIDFTKFVGLYYAIGGHPHPVLFIFLQSVMTRPITKLVRWKRL
jgi:hypothetical protein